MPRSLPPPVGNQMRSRTSRNSSSSRMADSMVVSRKANWKGRQRYASGFFLAINNIGPVASDRALPDSPTGTTRPRVGRCEAWRRTFACVRRAVFIRSQILLAAACSSRFRSCEAIAVLRGNPTGVPIGEARQFIGHGRIGEGARDGAPHRRRRCRRSSSAPPLRA